MNGQRRGCSRPSGFHLASSLTLVACIFCGHATTAEQPLKLKNVYHDLKDPGNTNPNADRSRADHGNAGFSKSITPPSGYRFAPVSNGWALMFDDVAGIGGTAFGGPPLIVLLWPEGAVSLENPSAFPLRATGNLAGGGGAGGQGGESPTWKLALRAKRYYVDLEPMPIGENPEISPKICTNAQPGYRWAKWKAIVKPEGSTATVTVVKGPVLLHRNKHDRDRPRLTVKDGDTFWVEGQHEVGPYVLKIRHDDKKELTIEKESVAFEFFYDIYKPLRYSFSLLVQTGRGAEAIRGGESESIGLAYDDWSVFPFSHSGYARGVLDGYLTIEVRPQGAYNGRVQAKVKARESKYLYATLSAFSTPPVVLRGVPFPTGGAGISIDNPLRLVIGGATYPERPYIEDLTPISIKVPYTVPKMLVEFALKSARVPEIVKAGIKKLRLLVVMKYISADWGTYQRIWQGGDWPQDFRGRPGEKYRIQVNAAIRGKVWWNAWANCGANIKGPQLYIDTSSFEIVR